MQIKFRRYLLAAFYELVLTFGYLTFRIRPVIREDGVGFTLKQGAVLFSLLVLLSLLGLVIYGILPRHPGVSDKLILFFQNTRSLGWVAIVSSSIIVIAGSILFLMHLFGTISIFGGLYTLAILPAVFLIGIQTFFFMGEVLKIRTIGAIHRRIIQAWQSFQLFSQVIIRLISRENLVQSPLARFIENLLCFLLPLWIYSRLFDDPLRLPYGLKALDFRYAFIEVLGYVLVLFLLAYLLPGWLGKLVGMVVVLYLFALPLSGLWETAYNESNIIRGLIPWNDANGYFQDANQLLDGGLISQFSAKRPLFTGLLSFLLAISGRNLQAALVILVAINALTCYAAAREVQQTHGILAAVMMSSIVFFFYRRFSGSTLTEPLGLALGLAGFALLWRGGSHHQGGHVWTGLFLSGLSLMARSGAYITLFFLVIWAGWVFRQKRALSLHWLGNAVSAVAAAFVVNYLILRLISVPGAMSNFNFSYTLYGIVSGGESWTYVIDQHPELVNMVEPDTSRRIYELAIERFRQNPAGVVQAAGKALAMFVQPRLGLYSFIRSGYGVTGLAFTHFMLLILSVMGGLLFYIRRDDIHLALLSFAGAGIFLSVPFVPPWDADYMRIYASSISFIAALPPISLVSLISCNDKGLFNIKSLGRYQNILRPNLSMILGVFLVGMIVIGSLGVRLFSHRPIFFEKSCPPGETAVYLRSNPGSAIIIWDDSQRAQTWVPNVRYDSFIGGHNLDFSFPEILAEFSAIQPDSIMISGYDLKSDASLVVIGDRRQVPQRNVILQACGNWSKSPVPRQFGFFYATELIEVGIE